MTKNPIIITSTSLLIGINIWWVLVVTLSLTSINTLQIQNILGFLFLALVPGILTVASLRLGDIAPWGKFVLSVGFSLLELMVTGLLCNTLLPYFGIERPLDLPYLILEISVLITGLIVVTWFRIPHWTLNLTEQWNRLFPSKTDLFLAFFPIVFVLQSIAGAITLNNGGTNLWTLTMLGEMGIFFLVLIRFSSDTKKNSTIPTSLFFISLSLLLMTSLRGWYITGHDIQLEFKVFELAKNAGFWNMESYRDPYNACMSITILPTLFYNFMNITDSYIFKFVFQILFALWPTVAFLVFRRWLAFTTSLTAVIYVIGFNTFYADMPFLIRQEIAFIFYGLMIFLLFEKKIPERLRHTLFVTMGFGVILSHYATNYSVLFIFGGASFFAVILRFLNKRMKINLFNSNFSTEKIYLTLGTIVVLSLASFAWTGLITNTGGGLLKAIHATQTALENGLFNNNRSTEALNFISFHPPSQQEELDMYIHNDVENFRKNEPTDALYGSETYDHYKYIVLQPERVPLTIIGHVIESFGINVQKLFFVVGQILGKTLEILAPLGLVYLLVKKVNIVKSLDGDFYLLCVSSLLFVFLIIVLPSLSTNYGVSRALQQTLFIIALPIVVGSVVVGNLAQKFYRNIASFGSIRNISKIESLSYPYLFPTLLSVFFFLYATSFIPQLVGGNIAWLHLNNSGKYYNDLLIKDSDVIGVLWLEKELISNYNLFVKLNISNKSNRTLTDVQPNIETATGVFPGILYKNNYVFLGETTINKQRTSITYNSDFEYSYPPQFLDINKNLLYNNGFARVYR